MVLARSLQTLSESSKNVIVKHLLKMYVLHSDNSYCHKIQQIGSDLSILAESMVILSVVSWGLRNQNHTKDTAFVVLHPKPVLVTEADGNMAQKGRNATDMVFLSVKHQIDSRKKKINFSTKTFKLLSI